MESAEPPTTQKQSDHVKPGDVEIISNWRIVNEKLLLNTISTIDVTRSPGRADLEDVVSLETCIRLEGDANEKREPCNITIKVKNGQRISRIAIVSEAFLIELYKKFGEYVSTCHAEFIDEFEQSAVYFADACLIPPTPEVSIKFARLKNPGTPMWLYGIRLSLTEPGKKDNTDQFDYNVIGDLLQSKAGPATKPMNWAMKILERSEGEEDLPTRDVDAMFHNFMSVKIGSPKHAESQNGDEDLMAKKKGFVECIGDCKDIHESDFKTYIDDRLREMEERLAKRIDAMNFKTNEKLDRIMKLLGDRSH